MMLENSVADDLTGADGRPAPSLLRMNLIAALVALSVFTLDLSLPLGVAAGVPYVALVLTGIGFPKSRHTFILAVIGTVLTVVGYYASLSGSIPWMVLANRGLALFAIWITALLIASRKHFENALRAANDSLEAKVSKRTEALQLSERRFKDFSEVASDWFWETDEQHRFTFFSDSYEESTGLSPAVLVGKTRQETRPPGMDDDSWQTMLENMANHRDFRNINHLRIMPDGTNIWFSINGRACFDEAGKFKGYRGTGADVTNDINITNEIQRTRAQLYNAIEVMEDGFVLFDADDRLVTCNQRYRDMFADVADILKPGVTFGEIVQVAADSFKIFDTLMDKDAWIKDRMDRHLNPSGSFDQKSARGNWMRIIEQKTTEGGIVGLRIDITKEKRKEEELRKLSHALEQNSSMVFITDVEGKIEYVNSMFTTVSGYTAAEALGKNPRILKSDETPAQTHVDLWQAIKSGGDWKGELKDRRKDGSVFWAYVTISPVKNEEGEITNFISMHEDITRRKAVERRELKAKKQAEMASRAKSELLANMSHELRTPLNAIIGFSQIFQGQLFGPLGNKKYAEYAMDITNSGEHLLNLINDILDVSAIEAGKLDLDEENLDVAAVIDSSLKMVTGRARDGMVSLKSNVEKDIPGLYGDERRIKQVLINLLSNAVKFTPAQGEVSVMAELNSADEIIFKVVDTGIGMSEMEVTVAMEQFGQVDSSLSRKYEGSGIGLPLTAGLIDLHGGVLHIDSAKGRGTTVTIKFPSQRTLN